MISDVFAGVGYHLAPFLDECAILALLHLDEFGLAVANAFGALGHPVRRTVLEYLCEEHRLHREEIVERAAADPDLSWEDAERFEIGLHHNHLPKLEEAGYVEYDWRNGDVVLWMDEDDVRAELQTA